MAGGLLGRYYATQAATTPATERVDEVVSFSWGGSPASGVGNDNWRVQWTGLLMPPQTGLYSFSLSVSQGWARVSLNGGQTIPSTDGWTSSTFLQANRPVPIVIDYYHGSFTAVVRLEWEGPGFYRHTIPKTYLMRYPSGWGCDCPANDNGDVCSDTHGYCLPTGVCACKGAYTGLACETYTCQVDECRGTDVCHDPAFGSGHQNCLGAGICTDGVCECDGDDVCSPGTACHATIFSDDEDCEGILSCAQSDTAAPYAPGMDVTFYSDRAGTQQVWTTAVPEIGGRWGSSPFPGVPNDNFAIHYRGFLAHTEASTSAQLYNFQCVWERGNCDFWVNDQQITSSATAVEVAPRGATPTPLAVLYDHTSFTGAVELRYRAAGTSDPFKPVPSSMLLRRISCEGACEGCCRTNGTCSCPYGRTGTDCQQVLANCPADRSTAVPGIVARFFADTAFETLESTTVVTDLVLTVPQNAMFSGIFRAPHRGWYRFFLSTSRASVRLTLGGRLQAPYATSVTLPVFFSANEEVNLLLEVLPSRSDATVSVTLEGPNFFTVPVGTDFVFYGLGECACLSTCVRPPNNFAPEFLAGALDQASVPEDAAVGRAVRTVRARDPDTGDGFGLTYRLLNDSVPFALNELNGVLSVNGTLDRDAAMSWVLGIEVTDTGVPAKTTTGLLTVSVACPTGFAEPTCTTCASGYGGSTCAACQPCSSNGDCGELGRCECHDGFTGSRCTQCLEHYYGSSCQRIPHVMSVLPTTGLDLGGTAVRVFVDNLDVGGTGSFVCRFGTKTVTATRASDGKSVTCETPRNDAGAVGVAVSNNGGTSFSYNTATFTFRAQCPPATCPEGQGVCAFGSCLCLLPYSGLNCATRLEAPSIAPVPDAQLVEGQAYEAVLSTTAGADPISWILASAPPGMTLSGRTIRWTAQPALTLQQSVSVRAQNLVGEDLRVWRLAVDFGYSAMVDELSNPQLVVAGVQELRGHVSDNKPNEPVVVRVQTSSVLPDVPTIVIDLPVVSDAQGKFAVALFVSQPGRYDVKAFHPRAVVPNQLFAQADAQKSFMALGLVGTLKQAKWRLKPGVFENLVIATLANPANVPITDLSARVVAFGGTSVPAALAGLTPVFSATTVGGLQQVTVGLAFEALNEFVDVRLGMTFSGTAGSVSVVGTPILFQLTVVPPAVKWRVTPGSLRGFVIRGKQLVLSAVLENWGDAAAEGLTVALPLPTNQDATQAVSFARGSVLPASVSPDGNFTLLVTITAGASAPLGQFKGLLALRANEGASAVNVPLDITVIADAFVDVLVLVRDEFSYFHPDKPAVQGAQVKLSNSLTQVQGISNATGHVLFTNVREGWYNVRSQALQHSADAQVLYLSTENNFIDVFLYRYERR